MMMASAVFVTPVAIHERLQRQRALIFAGSGDESLADVHGKNAEDSENRGERQ